MRNPKLDPQPGDVLVKHSASRVLKRTVKARRGNDIDYGNSGGNHFTCWITTWQEWATDAKVETIAP